MARETDRGPVVAALAAVGTHVSDHRDGLFADLVFAMAWVTMVSAVFAVLPDAPRWAFFLSMGGGVVAYYGFVASWRVATQRPAA